MLYRPWITKTDSAFMTNRMDHPDLLSGVVRLHILLHVAQHPVYGQWMIDELARHGYRLSPGTLYPMLSKMKPDGYLSSTSTRHGRTSVKFYAITHLGLERLAVARILLNELKAEGRT